MKFVKDFCKDECGAVTVDWVVLTAAIVGMGTIVITTIAGGATDQAGGLGAQLESISTDLSESEES